MVVSWKFFLKFFIYRKILGLYDHVDSSTTNINSKLTVMLFVLNGRTSLTNGQRIMIIAANDQCRFMPDYYY